MRGEALRSRGRAQRAAGEWRAPWNMLASAGGGGESVGAAKPLCGGDKDRRGPVATMMKHRH